MPMPTSQGPVQEATAGNLVPKAELQYITMLVRAAPSTCTAMRGIRLLGPLRPARVLLVAMLSLWFHSPADPAHAKLQSICVRSTPNNPR